MDNDGLIQNSDGSIDTTPVTGWTIGPIAETAVVAAIDYLQGMGTGGTERKRVQLTLLPAQALELAESLRRAAMLILERPVGEPLQ